MLRRVRVWLLAAGVRPSDAYAQLVARGTITRDAYQVAALPQFDRLYDDLVTYTTRVQRGQVPPRAVELKPPSRLGLVPNYWLRRREERRVQHALDAIDAQYSNNSSGISSATQPPARLHPLSLVKGIYVWGGVGCGKTMLMDLLYEHAPATLKKQRIHFHQFMLNVHHTMHTIRCKSKDEVQASHMPQRAPYNTSVDRARTRAADVNIYDELAQRLIADVELLCFDEVAVTDVADAMILRRLFGAFYAMGLVVVFTSNRPPEQLYLNGLNRGGFLPFIDLVQERCALYHMPSNVDHRLEGHSAHTYLSPMTPANDAIFEQLLRDCTKGMPLLPRKLQVFGRDVLVPRAAGGVCYFDFHELCAESTSSADFQAIARTFHTVFIKGVPQFAHTASDVKTRFLLLIDSLYERRCKTIVYAQVPVAQLQRGKADTELPQQQQQQQQLVRHAATAAELPSSSETATTATTATTTTSGAAAVRSDHLTTDYEREAGVRLIDEDDSAFQMHRCVSRLHEMGTREYLQEPHQAADVGRFELG